MNKKLLLLSLTLGLTGCLPSLHPLYTEDTLVFREELLGHWTDQQGEEESTWHFTRGEGKLYQLTHTDSKGKAGYFEVGLVQLGDQYFLDLYPDARRTDLPEDEEFLKKPWFLEGMNELTQFHLLPAHTFVRVRWEGALLQLEWLGSEWLDDLFKKKRTAIRHEEVDGQTVLTASTQELQKFLTKYGSEDRAFSDLAILSR